jgi:hypothetical protein
MSGGAARVHAQVLSRCNNVLGMHEDELLREVGKVMARPARPETDLGKKCRTTAKEVLRQFGRAGTTAWRAAHREVYGGQGGPTPYSYNPAEMAAAAGTCLMFAFTCGQPPCWLTVCTLSNPQLRPQFRASIIVLHRPRCR